MIDTNLEILSLSLVVELAVNLLIKATLVLSAAGVGVLLLRRTSASARYAVWSTALAMLIVLPTLSAVLPSWQIGPLAPTAADLPLSVDRVVLGEVSASRPVPVDEGADASSRPAVERTGAVRLDRGTVAGVLVGLWLCGAAVMLIRLGLHVGRVGQITRRASWGGGPEISRIGAQLTATLGLRRVVRVVVSDEVSVPFSWGIWSPVVVLPAGAKSWPTEQKRSVLLHEVGHVARWDYPVHLVIEVVRALYWPNPLVWLAAGRAAMERERACDDYALCHGTPSAVYASHLLSIARSQVEGRTLMGATTMAREPGLVERIRCVMNRQLARTRFRPSRLLATCGLALAMVLPLATLDVLGTKWQIPATEQLIEELESDEDPLVRRRAAWWLGEHEDHEAVPALVEALRDESAEVRQAAGWALGEIKDVESIEPLVWTLEHDEDPLVREMAALALGEIENPVAIEPLVDAFAEDGALRAAVVWALGEIRCDEARAARTAAFARWERTPWTNDEVWTGKLDRDVDGFASDVTTLCRQLRSEDGSERRRAVWSLGFLGILDGVERAEPVVDVLLDALRDPVPEVRAMAVWALDEVNPSRSPRVRRDRSEKMSLEEYRLNNLGYYLLGLRKYDRAIEVFQANVELHPQSANCYDSLGEAYMWRGDKVEAVRNYRKSLELDPLNANAVRMLEALEQSGSS